MIVGLDQKVSWNAEGQEVLAPPGRDSVLIVDLARREHPRIVANLPLENTVAGPPVNVAISPRDDVALVADSKTVVRKHGTLEFMPTNKLFVIDMKSNPMRLAQTLRIGSQPSGLSFNRAGTLALVGYRNEPAVGVLKIEGREVRYLGKIQVGHNASHVVFTPDGQWAIATEHSANRAALLRVVGDKVTCVRQLATGAAPYNADVSPDGQIAATTGARALTVIDLESHPPRVVGHVTVPPGVEGLAFSPTGRIAVAVAVRGSHANEKSSAYHLHGVAVIFRVEGAKLIRIKAIEVGRVPEAVGFTPDGRYLYVGNFLDDDFSILRVNGTDVTDTGKRFKVPGRPASARIGP